MWIAHYAPGLIAKALLAPRVPLSLLTFAGEAPDLLFFLLNFLGIESFAVDPVLARSGCFPYDTDYPYSHSIHGMLVLGIAIAFGYTFYQRAPVKVTLQEQLTIIAVTLSHVLLEWPAHREDVKVTPYGNTWIGEGMFDSPFKLFILELAIFYAGFWVYANYAPPAAKAGYTRSANMWKWVAGVFLAQQAQFCFSSAPTMNTRWVHAPIFSIMIIGSSYFLGKLEG